MNDSEDASQILDEVRRHHLRQVIGVLRRPGMYGRDIEAAAWLLLEAMAAIDRRSDQWRRQRELLRENGAATAVGVWGAYRGIVPADVVRYAVTSTYAEIAHRFGWLELDRALSQIQFQQMNADIEEWATRDRTRMELIEAFGAPSLRIGGSGPLDPQTLAYTTADRDDALICFHLWNARIHTGAGTEAQSVYPEQVVLAVRHRPAPFPHSFSFTPEGLLRRPTAGQRARLDPTVWIFHGDHTPHASGVFDTEQTGLAWASRNHVTGILAEYPHGGTYEVAVNEGRFTPSKPHHGTPEHVAAFSSGLRHIHLTAGEPD